MKALFFALLLLPVPAAAGPLTDLLMAPGVFADAPDGPLFAYAETVATPGNPATETRLLATIEPGEPGEPVRQVVLTRETGGALGPMAEFPAGGPNPVMLYFLEATARAMAEATGGSPFYIRNRMREALAAADVDAGDVLLRPFAADPNRARMGGFADLALRLRFDSARPGRVLELSADTATGGAGYHRTLRLITED